MKSENHEGVLAAAIRNRGTERSLAAVPWNELLDGFAALLAEVERRGLPVPADARTLLEMAAEAGPEGPLTGGDLAAALGLLVQAAREAGEAQVRGEREEA